MCLGVYDFGHATESFGTSASSASTVSCGSINQITRSSTCREMTSRVVKSLSLRKTDRETVSIVPRRSLRGMHSRRCLSIEVGSGRSKLGGLTSKKYTSVMTSKKEKKMYARCVARCWKGRKQSPNPHANTCFMLQACPPGSTGVWIEWSNHLPDVPCHQSGSRSEETQKKETMRSHNFPHVPQSFRLEYLILSFFRCLSKTKMYELQMSITLSYTHT